jgi:hypothetical protein
MLGKLFAYLRHEFGRRFWNLVKGGQIGGLLRSWSGATNFSFEIGCQACSSSSSAFASFRSSVSKPSVNQP